MSCTPDSEKVMHRLELEQAVHAHVAQLSTETGLQELAIEVVPFLKGQRPRINAQFRMSAGAPTITITERAVQELPHRVLRFLLAHEFGHFAHWGFRDKARRRSFTSLLLGTVACVLGVILAIAGIGGSIFGVLISAGVVIILGSPLILQARCRADEYRADAYAARLTSDLAAAREYFAALEQDHAKGSSDQGFRPWSSHPPVPDRLAAVEEILARANSDRSAP